MISLSAYLSGLCLCGLFMVFPVTSYSMWGPLPDNVNEPDALIFHMLLRSLFSCIIEGSDDKAVPSSCCEQEIELMEALGK